MKYDFDKRIIRSGAGSVKWDLADTLYKGSHLLPMWVADMDFEAPRPVIDALKQRAAQGVYGYTAAMPSYYDAVIRWFRKRHLFEIKKEWIVFTPGIVPAISMLIQALTEPGEKIIVQKPVYYPFMRAIKSNGRTIINNALVNDKGRYSMNFDDLETGANDPGARLLILCSPHNPVGRAWTRDELCRVGEICADNNIFVVSDEIHCDLVMSNYSHTPFASISNKFLMNSVTCTAPSKTFNLAGLQTSNLIIADPEIRKKFQHVMERNGINAPNAFGALSCEAAYNHGEEWLGEVLHYIEENFIFLKNFLKERLPFIRPTELEATYLAWLDFRELVLDGNGLKNLLRKDAKVALSDGYIFGEKEGDGFARMNIACPREILVEGLRRIESAVEKNA